MRCLRPLSGTPISTGAEEADPGSTQEGRHSADYDLSTAIEPRYAAGLVSLAETALADFDAIQSLPETVVFLAALLLADRWTRRG